MIKVCPKCGLILKKLYSGELLCINCGLINDDELKEEDAQYVK